MRIKQGFDLCCVDNGVHYNYTVNDHITLAPEAAYYRYEKGTKNVKAADNIYAGVLAIAAF